jgi:DMSO/TMAO reductase YedYZ heme-binding membrane subunit
MSTCGLFLLAVHVGALLVDEYMPFGVADLLVPMSSTYRPVPVALGIVAMYGVVVVIVASWLRKPIGTAWWRRTHLLAIPTFTLSLLHGVLAGTDGARPAMWWTYVGTGLVVVFLVVVRALTVGLRPERKAAAHHARRPAAEPAAATIEA